MARSRHYVECDVFSRQPLQGNALAVVLDADGLSDADMASFARWTNLAETTFVTPPTDADADYAVRIFTPNREMPFAGHPTLGTCMAWLHAGGVPRDPGVVRQACGVGVVEIDTRGDEPAFIAPPTDICEMPAETRTRHLDALGIDENWVNHSVALNNGPQWQVFELDSAERVMQVDSSRVRWPEFAAIGLIGAHPSEHECDFEVRMLAPSSGMSEDPITGSLNAAIAHWLCAQGRLASPIRVAQGTVIGRAGRVSVVPGDQNDVRIGGHVNILVEGTVLL